MQSYEDLETIREETTYALQEVEEIKDHLNAWIIEQKLKGNTINEIHTLILADYSSRIDNYLTDLEYYEGELE